MLASDHTLSAFIESFAAQKSLADRAIEQVSDEDLRRALDANTNSIAVIMKHVSGNLVSRFTDLLTSDGEKPWRDRDAEFNDTFAPGAPGRAEILATWESGWTVLFETLAALRPEHLDWQVFIRGESYFVPQALARSLAHTSYHVGQIVQTARVVCGEKWETITIARGGSRAFNAEMGFSPPGA
ncbi:MAG TPA: DUF1572 family protein [Phycisphaerales bacterium]|nr:DUF1572 family protein [Phycisphaerales bacterium]